MSKPAITRTLDRLEALGLTRRDDDPADRGSVLTWATKVGSTYLAGVGRLTREAAG